MGMMHIFPIEVSLRFTLLLVLTGSVVACGSSIPNNPPPVEADSALGVDAFSDAGSSEIDSAAQTDVSSSPMDVGATVDAGGPTTVKSIESFAAIVEQVSAAKATAAWPLQADKVLVDSDKGPQLFEPSLSVDTTLTGKIGKVRDAVVFNGEVMVAGTDIVRRELAG